MNKTTIHWTNWFAGLPANEIMAVRNQIMQACDISKSTFYDYRNQYREVPKLIAEKIQEIAGDQSLDFTWTDRMKATTTYKD